MPQSFTRLHYHLVFSTKGREPVITPDIQSRVWDYLGGLVRSAGGIPLEIGGVADHVHLLVTLRQQPALADVLRDIKANSSGWVHGEFPDAGPFWWQTGYGAFTVSHSEVPRVQRDIANQERHHRARTFQDEYRELLTVHGIEFDERYLWD